MLAQAPGKLVLSGAYAVLEGAPALVAAVSRYARADSSRRADFSTPEFRAALPDTPMPWFDASELRYRGQKLGLGSSAAILAATLGVLEMERNPDTPLDRLHQDVFRAALAAHRSAQGGGSGIDVAASVHGGVLSARLRPSGDLDTQPVRLPDDLYLVALFSGQASSTPELIAKVKEFGNAQPHRYRSVIADLDAAAVAALVSVERGDASSLVRALDAQTSGLHLLGQLSGADIVSDAVQRLRDAAHRQNGCVLPAGAGGGDIVLFAGTSPMSEEFEGLAQKLRHERVDLDFGARGLHRVLEDKP